MGAVLIHMGVERIIAKRGVIQPCRHVGLDQGSDFRQVEIDQPVIDRRAVLVPGVAHQCRGLLGTVGDLVQKALRGIMGSRLGRAV